MKKYICTVCGYIYDEAKGIPEAGIAPGTTWEQLPEDWACPLCGASKAEFKEDGANTTAPKPAVKMELPVGEIKKIKCEGNTLKKPQMKNKC